MSANQGAPHAQGEESRGITELATWSDPLAVPFLHRVARWVVAHELWVLAVVAPFLLLPNRWTPLVLALIPFTWLCRRAATGHFTIRTNMDMPIAMLVVMAVVGYAISVDLALSRGKFWGIVLEAAIFYGMVNGLRDQKGILWMAGILILLTTGVALFSLVATDWDAVRLVELPAVYDRLPRLVRDLPGSRSSEGLEFVNPRKVGAALAMLLPVPVALLLFGRHRGLRLLSAAAVLVGGIVFLLSQSLQGLLGVGMALLLIAVWRSRWFLLSIPVSLLAITAAVLRYGPGRLALTMLSFDHPLGIAVALRLDMWSRALSMLHALPYTGIGLSTFPIIQTQFYTGFSLGPEAHAHNLFLQTALDLGLPGLVALVWLLIAFYATAFWGYRATRNRDLRTLLVGLSAGVLAYIVHGLPDTLTPGNKAVAALFAMLGLAAAVRRHVSASETPTSTDDEETGVPLGPVGARIRRDRFVLGAVLFALLLSPLVVPAAPYLNLGAIRAHRALLSARTSGVPSEKALKSAEGLLRRALARNPDNAQVHGLLGSINAWQGNYAAAVDTLERRVALDGRDPMGRYAPFESLRRRIQRGEEHDSWADLVRVYSQWTARFPDRAENYVQAAIVWHRHRGNQGRAVALLRSGLDRSAEPEGLILHYLSRIEGSSSGG